AGQGARGGAPGRYHGLWSRREEGLDRVHGEQGRVWTESHGPRGSPAQEIRLVEDPVLDAEVRRIPARARGEVVRRDDDDEIAESEERFVRTAGDRGHAVRIPGARGVVRRGHFAEDAPVSDFCDSSVPAAA